MKKEITINCSGDVDVDVTIDEDEDGNIWEVDADTTGAYCHSADTLDGLRERFGDRVKGIIGSKGNRFPVPQEDTKRCDLTASVQAVVKSFDEWEEAKVGHQTDALKALARAIDQLRCDQEPKDDDASFWG